MLARMSKLQVHPDVQFVCCGDPRQLQCPQNSWKGQPCPVALEGSQMLASMCPTTMCLTTCRRFDPALQDFCARIARGDDLADLIAEGRQRFRCAGPWDTTVCLTHAVRQQVNQRTNAREAQAWTGERVEIKGRDGPMTLWPGLRVIGAGWNPKITNGAFHVVESMGEEITLEGGIVLTQAEAAKSLRLAHAITIDSSQSKTLTGRIRVLETSHHRGSLQSLQ